MYGIEAENLLIFVDFRNDVALQPLNEFLCSTPEMKARDAYVPFQTLKLLNKKMNLRHI